MIVTRPPVHYEICVEGVLEPRWSVWFDGLDISGDAGGKTTIISGPISDQAALHGLLSKIRDLGLPLIAVRRIPPTDTRHGASNAATTDHQESAQAIGNQSGRNLRLPADRSPSERNRSGSDRQQIARPAAAEGPTVKGRTVATDQAPPALERFTGGEWMLLAVAALTLVEETHMQSSR